MKVLELMKTHVIKTSPDATMRDAVDMMDLYQISGLPVVNSDGKLLGVVTEHDVIHALIPRAEMISGAGDKELASDIHTLVEAMRNRPVSECMTAQVVSVDENANVIEAATLMLTKRIKRLPVTSENRLVGIISRIDICQAVLEGQI